MLRRYAVGRYLGTFLSVKNSLLSYINTYLNNDIGIVLF